MLPLSGRLYALTGNRVKFLVTNFHKVKYGKESASSVIVTRGKKDNSNLHNLIKPVSVNSANPDDIAAGELKKFNKKDLIKVLNTFFQKPETASLAAENGLDGIILKDSFSKFRKFCISAEQLPTDLHYVISDILQGAGHHLDIFPYFLRHVKEIFPHLECLDDLKKVSDLRNPPSWYPEARLKTRKIIFHSGPTNSGKTYHALERFVTSKSGLYCGPLKLLAVEVFKKANARGTPCDLVTGEDKQLVQANGESANHVSCTVEMSPVNKEFEVAVIDEIQMLKDPQRGWAWTRAFLGLNADEVHVCGEDAAVELIKSLSVTAGDTFEVKKYSRLTKLEIEDEPLGMLSKVRDGDCIVCFNKQDIYRVSQDLQTLGREIAVIYGGLPPGAKNRQCEKFNDPNDPCKILVATDAVGMGLNLSIGRIIFYSLKKKNMNEKGETEISTISVSQALQIAGRAGRFGTRFETGYVTTYRKRDMDQLRELLAQMPEPINQAGLHPTADMVELYAYYLPTSSFFNILDIFVSLSTLDDSLYFICDLTPFKANAEIIEHVPLPLRSRYILCCSPIDTRKPFISAMFLKFARRYSANQVITFGWLCKQVQWPLKPPQNVLELVHCENIFDVFDLYLWLSYRFPDYFPHSDLVREVQVELDKIIQEGVSNIVQLLKNSTKVPGESIKPSPSPEEPNVNLVIRDLFVDDDDSVEDEPVKVIDKKPVDLSKQKLSDRLISEGLITPLIMEQLKTEWKKEKLKSKKNHPNPNKNKF